MKTVFKILIQLVIIISLISCEENSILGIGEEYNTGDFANYFGDNVERDFIGKVLDESSSPISGVNVIIGEENATTDSNGIFILKAASVYTNFAFVKASKIGYVEASISLIPTEGVNKLSMVMTKNPTVQTVNSGSEATLSLTNGATVRFSGDYIDKDSVAYSGNVYVRLINLGPEDGDFERKIPGMLYGKNRTGHEHFLESYGTFAIELEAEDGRTLYLAKDSPADITIPLNSALLSVAPASIPLWYFDSENGYWVEDGEANLIGNKYLGTINHVANWNFSTSFKLNKFYFKLSDSDDLAIANQKFSIAYVGSDYPYNTKHLITNSNGTVNCIIPENHIVNIDVTNNSICGNTAFYSTITNSSYDDKNVGIMIESSSNALTTTITGLVDDCNETPVLDGYVFLNVDDNQYFDLLIDEKYDLNMLHCEAETTFSVRAFDYENKQKSPEVSYFFNSPTTYLANLPACNSIYEFIQYTIDDAAVKVLVPHSINTTLTPFNAGYNAPSIAVFEPATDAEFRLFGLLNDAPYIGTYGNYVIGDLTPKGMNIGQVIDVSNTNNNITYHLVKLGEVGEFLDMHFNGEYEDAAGVSHNIVGVIHVIRDVK